MKKVNSIAYLIVCVLLLISCQDFIEVAPPRTALVKSAVFTNDESARSAVLGIYGQMNSPGFSGGDLFSISFLASLSSDELRSRNTNFTQVLLEFNDNAISPSNPRLLPLWSEPYQYIYKSNAIIEGLASSRLVSEGLKRQLEGEAKFIRAFSHFYLLNLFGDVPLVTSTDFRANAVTPRTAKEQVYRQIISDLTESQNLLPNDFSVSSNERTRPNKATASALLARVYLFTGEWQNSETQASSVINNTSTYGLVSDLNGVFLKNSMEAIWQISSSNGNTREATTFIPANAVCDPSLLNSFEPGDKRRIVWMSPSDGSATTYYPSKYKAIGSSSITEYSMVFRLAELYLIRAEARAHLGKLTESIADLDAIRARAGLPLIQSINPTISQLELLNAIERERKVELFAEWGHRWFDLKRYNTSDLVLSALKTDWQSTDVLYPIPQLQIQNDPAMANSQNPGY